MTAAFALTLTLALLAASSAGAHSLRMPLCCFSSLEGMAVDADDSGAAVARSARHALDFAEFDKPLSADEHAFHHHHHHRMARDAADDLEPTIEKHAPTLQEEPLAAPAVQQQQQQQQPQQSQVEFFEQGDSQSSDDAQLDDDQEATLGGSLDGLEPLNEGNEELAEAKRAARQSEAFAGLFGNDADSERPAVPATPQEAGLDQQQGAQREGDAPAADSEDFPTPGAIEGDSAAQKNAADAEPAAETAHVAENDDENIPAAGENKSEHAGTKAEAAENKAETAETKAEAKGKTAEAKVETAEAKVETAEAKVETAEDKVKSAEDKVESAETKAESAEAKVESAEAKVESTETKAETAEAKESSVAAA